MEVPADPVTILCCPCAPARTGNGLAMRAGVLLEALAGAGPVDVVIVPVAGPPAPCDWARALARSVQVVGPVATEADARGYLDRDLADPWVRERLVHAAPLPGLARGAPASLGAEVRASAGAVRAVVGLRTYLAPFAVALARRLGATRLVVDADDDDVALLSSLGDDDAAAAFDRMARAWLPEADTVWAASTADADSLRERYGLGSARTIPNAVRIPAVVPEAPGAARLLFVGNLTYAPNVDAARTLVLEVLPRVQAVRPDASLLLVGPHAPGALDDLAAQRGVGVIGAVPDVASYYAASDLVVVPLRHGSGTRIKLLEAAAFGRAAVASPAAVAGLEFEADRDVVVADDAARAADAVLALLAAPGRAEEIAAAARAIVRSQYSVAAVAGAIRAAVSGVPEPEVLGRRVLWHAVEVHAPAAVRDALDAVLPTARHDFPAGRAFRYDVEPAGAGFGVFEDGDAVARVRSSAEARDVVHARFHRRVFEGASLAGWLRIHGALVDIGGVRVLLTGPEGAGKSTLALRLLLDGFTVQGDESVLVRGTDSVAVARPIHCKPGTEAVVPELAALGAPPPMVNGIGIVDPGRLGHDWRLSVRPLDHVVVLGPQPPETGTAALLEPLAQTAVLPDLVEALFPVTESKAALLGSLSRALTGVACHRLARAEPAAMERALVAGLR